MGHATRQIVAQFPKYLLIKCVVEKCRNTKVFCASPIFMSHKHHIITHKYCTIGSPLAAIGVCFVAHFVGVRNVIADRQQHFGNPFAALSQTVRSRRGPIYRARIYENTHEMGDGNACVVMWKCVFNNVNARN